MGRNYASPKTFENLLEELKQMSGTRYNPDFIKMIINTEPLRGKLSRLLNDGWEYNYYEVYLEYFNQK